MTIIFRNALVGALLAGAAVASLPASAHHSYAMFDRTKTVTVKGTVKEFHWANPHIYLWLTVQNSKTHQEEIWAIEGSSPNVLVRMGWTRDLLAVGDKLTVDLHPLKDGRTGGFFVKANKGNGSKDIVGFSG